MISEVYFHNKTVVSAGETNVSRYNWVFNDGHGSGCYLVFYYRGK
jgi:hypothetical protein